jgi:hypothetical protein
MAQYDIRLVVAVAIVPVLVWLSNSLHNAFRPGLRQIPGPWLAKFSSLWRYHFVQDGSAHDGYRELHEKFGPIVRTAPNVVDISDPAAIATIYGINSKFGKVCSYLY